MKRFILVIILIFSLSFFVGCSDDNNKQTSFSLNDYIMLSLSFNSDGTIVQSLDFSVNTKGLEKITTDEEIFTFKSNLIEQLNTIRNEFLFGYALHYVKNPIEEYKINQGVILTDVLYNTNFDSVGFDVIFTSTNAWNYYHNIDTSKDQLNKENSLFYNRHISTGKFVFSSAVKINEEEITLIGKRYKEKYIEASKNLSFEIYLSENYRPCYVYNYATPSNRLHSDSQIEFLDSKDLFHHVWLVEDENLSENNMISIYYISINYGWWYFFAILISLCIMVIILVVDKIKIKKRH